MFSLLSILFILFAVQSSLAKVLVTYYPSWTVYRNFSVSDIPVQYHSHIIYAFAKIVDNEIALVDPYADIGNGFTINDAQFDGNFKRLLELKQLNPTVKTLIAVGGWTLSGNFSSMASTTQTRQKFAVSCAAFIEKYGFDGVDIDWEYPTTNQDRQSYTLLMNDLRSELDKLIGSRRVLTATIPASPSSLQYFDLAAINSIVDFTNVMAYDFFGSWSPTTGHQANLYSSLAGELSVDSSLQYIKSITGNLDKMVMGIPAYGRAWANVSDINNGTGQAYVGIPPGSYENGVFDFKDIANLNSSFTRFYDDKVVASWIYDSSSQIYISYDEPNVVTKKAEYVKRENMLGMMIWEASGDSGQLARSAFTALNQALTTLTTMPMTTTSVQTTTDITTSSVAQTTSTSLTTNSVQTTTDVTTISVIQTTLTASTTTSSEIPTTTAIGSTIITPSLSPSSIMSTSIMPTTTSSLATTVVSTFSSNTIMSSATTFTSSSITTVFETSNSSTPTVTDTITLISSPIISPATSLPTANTTQTIAITTMSTITITDIVKTTTVIATKTLTQVSVISPISTKIVTSPALTVNAMSPYQTSSPSSNAYETNYALYPQEVHPNLPQTAEISTIPAHDEEPLVTSFFVQTPTVAAQQQVYETRVCKIRRKRRAPK